MMFDNLLEISEYDSTVEDFKYRIFKCVDKFSFVFLYVFNREVLHLGLVAAIRESGKLDKKDDEQLEELVWSAMEYIAGKIILTHSEIVEMLSLIGDRVRTFVAKNKAIKNQKSGNNWLI